MYSQIFARVGKHYIPAHTHVVNPYIVLMGNGIWYIQRNQKTFLMEATGVQIPLEIAFLLHTDIMIDEFHNSKSESWEDALKKAIPKILGYFSGNPPMPMNYEPHKWEYKREPIKLYVQNEKGRKVFYGYEQTCITESGIWCITDSKNNKAFLMGTPENYRVPRAYYFKYKDHLLDKVISLVNEKAFTTGISAYEVAQLVAITLANIIYVYK